MEGHVHGIERARRACQPPVGDEVGEFIAPAIRVPGAQSATAGAQLGNRHAILGQGSGLVGAQHRRRTERFDGRRPARQHPGARDTPGAHRHEDRQHHRKFLRQHGHADGDAVEQCLKPAAPEEPVQKHGDRAHQRAADRGDADHVARLLLKPRRFGFDAAQRLADLADLAARTCRRHLGDAAAAHHEGSGEDAGQIIASGTAGGRCVLGRALADRNGFAGQEGFVALQVGAMPQDGIGGYAVAFGENDRIAAHHLAAGDTPPLAVADHQGARARQVAQGFQHALGAGLLHDGDADRQHGENEQNDRLLDVTERQIDQAAAEQQCEHRLAQHLERDPQRRAAVRTRQFVGPLGGEPRRRFRGAQSGMVMMGHGRHDYGPVSVARLQMANCEARRFSVVANDRAGEHSPKVNFTMSIVSSRRS
jgi:hypothetical protein